MAFHIFSVCSVAVSRTKYELIWKACSHHMTIWEQAFSTYYLMDPVFISLLPLRIYVMWCVSYTVFTTECRPCLLSLRNTNENSLFSRLSCIWTQRRRASTDRFLGHHVVSRRLSFCQLVDGDKMDARVLGGPNTSGRGPHVFIGSLVAEFTRVHLVLNRSKPKWNVRRVATSHSMSGHMKTITFLSAIRCLRRSLCVNPAYAGFRQNVGFIHFFLACKCADFGRKCLTMRTHSKR